MPGRVICHRLPACPGRDSRHTIRHNSLQPGNPWWVFYEPPASAPPIPADNPHPELVALVNDLKIAEGQKPGGSFSINEHGQVIARTTAPRGTKGRAIHLVNVSGGAVATYKTPVVFQKGALTPLATPAEGDVWPGPLCGMTYSFAAPSHPKPPSRNVDEIWIEVEGQNLQLSQDAGVRLYPPSTGPLADFLAALRRRIPHGGRFRVNEFGRAFTSDDAIYIGKVPMAQWFRPLTARS